MSEKRLSNLQKWILVNCYKVTVLRVSLSAQKRTCLGFVFARFLLPICHWKHIVPTLIFCAWVSIVYFAR